MKKILTLKTFAVLFLCGIIAQTASAQAQKSCDLGITFGTVLNHDTIVHLPEDSVTVPFGDTIVYGLFFWNNGPDTILVSDTISYSISGLSAAVTNYNLPPGDTLYVRVGSGYTDGEETEGIILRANLKNNMQQFNQINSRNDATLIKITFIGSGTSGMHDVLAVNKVKLFPNPGKDLVHISGLLRGEEFTTNIYDILGRKVKHANLNIQNNDYIIDICTFTPGIYWLYLQGKNWQYSSQLIKE